MSGIMTALVGSGGVAVVSFTVTVGTGTNSNGTTTQTFWGFSNVGVPTGGTNGLYYPNSLALNVGLVSPATPTIGAIEVIGAYSIGVSSSSIATYYAVILDGDASATPNLISNMYVDGNQVVYSTKTVTYFPLTRDSSNVSGSAPSTLFLFTLTATAATLFGTTAGATKTVSIY